MLTNDPTLDDFAPEEMQSPPPTRTNALKPQPKKYQYFTASDAANRTAVQAEIHKNSRPAFEIPFYGWEAVDNSRNDYFNMLPKMKAPELWGILAESGHGKTTTKRALFRQWVEEIQKYNALNQRDDYALVVPFENAIEEDYAMLCEQLGAKIPYAEIRGGKVANLDELRRELSKASAWPIIYYGMSAVPEYGMDEVETFSAYFDCTTKDLMAVTAQIWADAKHPTLPAKQPSIITTGNVQLMRSMEKHHNRAEQLSEIAGGLKMLAMKRNCIVVDEIQARRATFGLIPKSDDTEGSNGIQQPHDVIIAQGYPIKDVEIDANVDPWDLSATPGTFIHKIVKAREAKGNGRTYSVFSDMDTRTLAFGEYLKAKPKEKKSK